MTNDNQDLNLGLHVPKAPPDTFVINKAIKKKSALWSRQPPCGVGDEAVKIFRHVLNGI